MHRIIIPGPPGTGKTHRLMYYLDEELKKTDPEKIAYIAFSNAAANVAKERIKNDKVYVSTMHSMGTRECGINTKTQLLKGVSYFKFKDFWKYLVRTKVWDTKKYQKQKTARMLETLFDAEEIPGKINNKSARYMALPTLKLEKPNTRKDKMKEAPFA